MIGFVSGISTSSPSQVAIELNRSLGGEKVVKRRERTGQSGATLWRASPGQGSVSASLTHALPQATAGRKNASFQFTTEARGRASAKPQGAAHVNLAGARTDAWDVLVS
jgi:hypothetical protein